MNYSRPTLNRRQWCAEVAVLCAPGMAEKAAAALSAMLPALQHFPDYLFTNETAAAVAEAPRRLACPAFDEIKAALNAYRREFIHEPERFRLSAPSEPEHKPPTESEAQAVANSVAAALKAIAEAHAHRTQVEELATGYSPLPDVSYSGQALGDLRRKRFAALLAERKILPHEIPKQYRPAND